VHCCDCGTGNAKTNTGKNHGNRIKKDANEEAESNNGTAKKNAEGRTRGEEEVGGKDCEREDKTTCDLVDRCVDILEGIVAETGNKTNESMTESGC
jgi:hypothetical protein